MSGCNCGGAGSPGRPGAARPGKLGRCRVCIYSSLALAAAGWAAHLALAPLPRLALASWAALAAGLAATLLFSAHLGAIALRAVERAGATLPSR